MEKIENCPFCGGMAVLKRIPDATYFPYYVRCSNVNCEMNVATCSRKTPEEAIKIWNHRPGEADAQPGWIPCDSELPKPNEEDGNGFYKAYLVQDGRWMDVARWDGKYWVAWGYSTVLLNVVAWCELPKPYREGGQNDGKN